MGVLLGNTSLRFADRGRLTFRGKRNLVLTSVFSPGPKRLRERPVRASPGKSVPCPASTLSARGLTGDCPEGPPPGDPPLFSPNTIGRPSEECSPACSPRPSEQSSRHPTGQARPERLSEPCAEPKRSLGKVFGDTARDSWRAATHLTRKPEPSIMARAHSQTEPLASRRSSWRAAHEPSRILVRLTN